MLIDSKTTVLIFLFKLFIANRWLIKTRDIYCFKNKRQLIQHLQNYANYALHVLTAFKRKHALLKPIAVKS